MIGIRKGRNATFAWTLLQPDGSPVDVSAASSIKVVVRHSIRNTWMLLLAAEVVNGELVFTFNGADQVHLGKYTLSAYVRIAGTAYEAHKPDSFELVSMANVSEWNAALKDNARVSIDAQLDTFVNGLSGHSARVGSRGTWETFDDDTRQWKDTEIIANQIIQAQGGPTGPSALPGTMHLDNLNSKIFIAKPRKTQQLK